MAPKSNKKGKNNTGGSKGAHPRSKGISPPSTPPAMNNVARNDDPNPDAVDVNPTQEDSLPVQDTNIVTNGTENTEQNRAEGTDTEVNLPTEEENQIQNGKVEGENPTEPCAVNEQTGDPNADDVIDTAAYAGSVTDGATIGRTFPQETKLPMPHLHPTPLPLFNYTYQILVNWKMMTPLLIPTT
jgi:hypothetical protein